jgi:hypothetical protein
MVFLRTLEALLETPSMLRQRAQMAVCKVKNITEQWRVQQDSRKLRVVPSSRFDTHTGSIE